MSSFACEEPQIESMYSQGRKGRDEKGVTVVWKVCRSAGRRHISLRAHETADCNNGNFYYQNTGCPGCLLWRTKALVPLLRGVIGQLLNLGWAISALQGHFEDFRRLLGGARWKTRHVAGAHELSL